MALPSIDADKLYQTRRLDFSRIWNQINAREQNQLIERCDEIVRSELDMAELWLYEPKEDCWSVYRIMDDGDIEELAVTETEGLAVNLIWAVNNSECPPQTGRALSTPENFLIEPGINDDWNVFRVDEDDETEEWLASADTERLVLYVAHVINGTL